MNRAQIMEEIGADNWEQVVAEFEGEGVDDIERALDDMFPGEENNGLAQAITEQLR